LTFATHLLDLDKGLKNTGCENSNGYSTAQTVFWATEHDDLSLWTTDEHEGGLEAEKVLTSCSGFADERTLLACSFDLDRLSQTKGLQGSSGMALD
jgi:hypothetical protein